MGVTKIEVGKTYTSKNNRALRMKAVDKSVKGVTFFEIKDTCGYPFIKTKDGLYSFIDEIISNTLEEVTEHKEFNPNLN